MPRWPGRLPATGRLLVVVLAVAGLASWWWLGKQRAVESASVDMPRQPDSYFRDLVVTGHDAEGQPDMYIEAGYAEHFEEEPWVHLRDLRATSATEGPGWRLVAQRGRMSDDGVNLETWGDVVLTRGEESGDPMQLRTDRLQVNTDTQLAVTDAAVLITHGASRITGAGLWVSLADDRLRIESDVEARYEK